MHAEFVAKVHDGIMFERTDGKIHHSIMSIVNDIYEGLMLGKESYEREITEQITSLLETVELHGDLCDFLVCFDFR